MLRRLACKQLFRRPVTTGLLLLSIALAVGISVFIATLHQGLQQGLTLATEPFSLLVSSPGSQHQLVLNTVFLQDHPLPNLPFAEVTKLQEQKKLVKSAVPLAFGDSYKGYRIVGASADIFAMRSSPKAPLWLSPAAGRTFEKPFEAVIGSAVAKNLKLKPGDQFVSTHGLLPRSKHAHADHPFTVVGVLKDVKGPYDQAILTPIESIWKLHEHKDAAKPKLAPAAARVSTDHSNEVSAILVEPVGYSEAYQLASRYQSRKDAQLVFPAQVIVQFFNLMGRGEKMWRPVGAFLLLLSLVIVSVTSYLSTLTRMQEYAVIRALGASDRQIALLWLWQDTFLVLGGTILGGLLGTGVCGLVSHAVGTSTAVTMPVTLTLPTILMLAAVCVIGIIVSWGPMVLWLRRKVDAVEL